MRQSGFTLIELLTVIAIIAVLAAIIVPVAVRAKDSAYHSSDMSSLNELRGALQLYKVDQGGYPPALFGYVNMYQSGPSAGQVIPADQIRGYLYPKRVDSVETFRPAYDRTTPLLTTTAVWPNVDSTPVGSGAQLDLNGDGKIDSSDDNACSRQAFGSTTTVLTNPADNTSAPLQFYKISGYDVAQVPNLDGTFRNEIHYSLWWSNWGIGNVNGCTGKGNSADDPRQLGYAEPPADTVVTWDSFFRDYQNGVPQRTKREIVLFLGGGAKNYDSRDVFDKSWRLRP